MGRNIGITLVGLLLASFPLRAAAPPGFSAYFTQSQEKRLQEAGKHWAKARQAAEQAEYQKAIAPGRAAVDLIRSLIGDHPHVVAMLGMLADWCQRGERFVPAIRARAEALAILKKLHGSDHWRVTDARLALADARAGPAMPAADRERLAQAQRRYRSARKHSDEGDPIAAAKALASRLELTRRVHGDWHLDSAQAMSDLAAVLRELGEYTRCAPLMIRVRDVYHRILGPRHPRYAASIHNLAALYWSMRDFRRAEPLFLRALSLQKELLGEEDLETARTMANLAQLYKDDARLAQARPLAERALAIRKELLDESHPGYSVSLHNLGALYQELGDRTGAMVHFQKALALRRKYLGDKHPNVAYTLNSLGYLHYQMENPRQAKACFEQALEVFRRLGQRHPLHAMTLNNLVGILVEEEDYTRALRLSERAVQQVKETLGEKHPDYAVALNNLGLVYWAQGNLARSLPIFERALALRKAALGERHPSYAESLDNLALQYLCKGDSRRAALLYRQATEVSRQHVEQTFSVLGTRQRLGLLAKHRRYLSLYLCAAVQAGTSAEQMYEHVLFWQGALNQRQVEERALAGQPALAPLAAELRAARLRLAQLTASVPPPGSEKRWLAAFIRMEEEKEALEEKMARTSKDFRSLRRQRKIKGDEVTKSLPVGVGLVELVEYAHYLNRPIRKGHDRFESRLLAFVLVRDQPIRCVALGAIEPIARAVAKWRRPMQTVPPGVPDTGAAAELRRRVWLPIARWLGSAVNTVLVVPDRLLSGLPLAALPGSKRGQYLIEEVTLGTLPSGRYLVDAAGRSDSSSSNSEGLLAVGGAAYGKNGRPWPDLPGSQMEAERIGRLYRERFGARRAPRILTGERASKPALAGLLALGAAPPAWRHLHLATHGFFAPPLAEEASGPTAAMMNREVAYHRNPMLACGVVLAGANRDPQTGILTAEEVTSLDLRGTDLVVLSACQTGLGRKAEGEGVLGLQRAFHLAGARTVVASLWSVSDPATSVLMEHFYSRLWGKKKVSKLEALRQAQLFVLRNPKAVLVRAEELRKTAGAAVALRGISKKAALLPQGSTAGDTRSHPAWWAAFVLSGDWR
jgi:CHAT domain-containing protein/tetratricopeptide (TPR) repeat protein